MLGVMPSVYAHTQDYSKGYKLGKEDGKSGGGGYGSIECSVSMSNKSCSDYGKGYDDGYSSTCGKNPDGCSNILTAISPDPFYIVLRLCQYGGFIHHLSVHRSNGTCK
jgi:hypothetical protein